MVAQKWERKHQSNPILQQRVLKAMIVRIIMEN